MSEEVSTNQEKPKGNPNPSPSTRFGAENGNPRSDGRWKAEDSISYQYNRLVRLNVTELDMWLEDNPEGERTVAQDIAYQAVVNAREDLAYLKEVTDRTEGKAPQTLNIESGLFTEKELTVTVLDDKHNDEQEAEEGS